jgi:hypothetical protein
LEERTEGRIQRITASLFKSFRSILIFQIKLRLTIFSDGFCKCEEGH